MTLVKICGLTNAEDTRMAMDLGADLLGFVNAEGSPRYLTPDEIARIISEVQPVVPTVLVTHLQDVDQILNNFDAATTDILQLHAPLTLDDYRRIMEAVPVVIANVSVDADQRVLTRELRERVYRLSEIVSYILLDTRFGGEIGGTGRSYDWSIAAALKAVSHKPIIIAGGLNSDNVAEAVRQVHPFAVDVSSGVESAPGRKDVEMMRAFIENAKMHKYQGA